MKYALSIFPTEYAIRIDELARAAEARGFESLWVPEHTHIPTSRRTPYPGGAELPKEYSHTLDPFVALSAAAAVTTRLKIGTAICLVIERDPIVLAKEVASLDLLSGGRFMFGVGVGWNAEEMENHGTNFKTRRTLMKERIEAMKAMWTREEAQYHGRFVNFDPIYCPPKPVQKPYPPLLLGVANPATRHIDYLDGWFPPRMPLEQFMAMRDKLTRRLASRGRDPQSVRITVHQNFPDRSFDTERRTIDAFAQAGVERIVYRLTGLPPDRILPWLDQLARLAG
jgi:probable F420-dependent oxidoreductase